MQRHVFPNIEQLSQAFADFAETTLNQKQHATLVVPGGNTPRYYLPALAKCKLPWDRITVTLSDERWGFQPLQTEILYRMVRVALMKPPPHARMHEHLTHDHGIVVRGDFS